MDPGPEPATCSEQDNTIRPDLLSMALHEACKSVDLPGVKQLVQHGVDVNRVIGPPGEQDYCLITATKTKFLPLVQFLLDNRALPQIGAVRAAALDGNAPMLRLLLRPIKEELSTCQAHIKSMNRWRMDLASIWKDTMINGRAGAAQELMVFHTRLVKPDSIAMRMILEKSFSTAVRRKDYQSVDDFLDMGALALPKVLKILADHHQFDLLHKIAERDGLDPEAFTLALPSVARADQPRTLDLLINRGARDDGNALVSAAKSSRSANVSRLLEKFQYSATTLKCAVEAAAGHGDHVSTHLLLNIGSGQGQALEAAARANKVSSMNVLLADPGASEGSDNSTLR